MWRIAVVVAFGCGDPSADAPAPTPADPSLPAGSSAEAIGAFVDDGGHTGAGWVSESASPREANTVVSPHGRVQVWLNDTLVASQEAGNGSFDGTAHDEDAMVVKEMFDDVDVLVGRAAMLKVAGDLAAWAYWCDGPADRCGVPAPTDPTWGIGRDSGCSFCHGGLVFNVLP